MIRRDANRYSRAAIAAVILFLVFDFTALALNFWLSWHIEKQAIAINLAGRQRMLSQRMTKVLLQLERLPEPAGQAARPLLAELRLSAELFDNTLHAFAAGHLTQSGGNQVIYLEAVTDPPARALVDQAQTLWHPYRSLIQAVLANGESELAKNLPACTAYAVEHNIELLTLMNRLTSELEISTQEKAAHIRLYQGLAFLLALVNVAGAILLYNHRLREADKHQCLLDEIINKVSTSVMVLDSDASTILKANQTAEDLFGYRSGELNGLNISDLVQVREGNCLGLRKDGSTFPARADRNQAYLDQHRLFIETITDMTEQRLTEAHLSGLAYHDLLTHLPNRLLFDDRLRLEIAHAQRLELKLGVLFIDLDNFKPVNDQHGHDIGDRLLQAAAARLKLCLRESDTISRRGGDEFTAIIGNIGSFGSHEDCARVAQMIIAQMNKPFLIDNRELHIGASVGISLYPDDGDNAQQLLGRADEAMYRAKQRGRGVYCHYRDDCHLPASTNVRRED